MVSVWSHFHCLNAGWPRAPRNSGSKLRSPTKQLWVGVSSEELQVGLTVGGDEAFTTGGWVRYGTHAHRCSWEVASVGGCHLHPEDISKIRSPWTWVMASQGKSRIIKSFICKNSKKAAVFKICLSKEGHRQGTRHTVLHCTNHENGLEKALSSESPTVCDTITFQLHFSAAQCGLRGLLGTGDGFVHSSHRRMKGIFCIAEDFIHKYILFEMSHSQ